MWAGEKAQGLGGCAALVEGLGGCTVLVEGLAGCTALVEDPGLALNTTSGGFGPTISSRICLWPLKHQYIQMHIFLKT